jgi:hypothetical protein
MLIAVTLSLLLLTVIGLIVLRTFRPDLSLAWPLAAVGTFVAWICTFLWQFNLPIRLTLINYNINGAADYSLSLLADRANFPYAIGITSLVMAAVLVSTLNAKSISHLGWINILLFAVLGLAAVLAETPLTLITAWAFIDLAILVGSVYLSDNPHVSENAVWSYSGRLIGLGFVLWAGILSANQGQQLLFSSIPQNIAFILLIGVTIRIGAMLNNLPYENNSLIQNPQSIIVSLISAVASLVLLSRINFAGGGIITITLFCIVIGIAGLMFLINWLRTSTDMGSLPLWITAVAALAVAATLQGNPVGATGWGSSILFIGGVLYFYTARNRWLTALLPVAAFSLSSLPYSLTATAWEGNFDKAWVSLIVLLPLQSLLITGFFRSIALGNGEDLGTEPNWVKVFYPIGLVTLFLTGIILGITGWAGAGQVGAWIPALIVGVLTATLSFILLRIPLAKTSGADRVPSSMAWIGSVQTAWWILFRAARRLTELLSQTFEGDGGFLWTILLLLLFVSIISVYIR